VVFWQFAHKLQKPNGRKEGSLSLSKKKTHTQKTKQSNLAASA